MIDLFKAHNAYHDFGPGGYFTVCFGSLPSKLTMEVPMGANKKNMEAVLEVLQPITHKLEVEYKKWNTKDVKDGGRDSDFVYHLLLKSNQQSLLISVALAYEELAVDFYYDHKDKALEEWILDTHDDLRNAFGELKSSSFKVLARNDNGFYTEDIKTGDFKAVDIQLHYNDDFEEIHTLVEQAISTNRSGLILLHGAPGTGKTSYIKGLISDYEKKKFIFIQNDFVKDLLKPEFITFLLRYRNAILIIEDAEKVIMARDTAREDSVVSTILQLTDGLFSDYLNIKIICTFNADMKQVDKALLRKGRMIAKYEFTPLTPEKASALSAKLGFMATSEAMTLADIYKQKEKDFGADKEGTHIGF